MAYASGWIYTARDTIIAAMETALASSKNTVFVIARSAAPNQSRGF